MRDIERSLDEYIRELQLELKRLEPLSEGKPGVLGRIWEIKKTIESLESILINND